MASIDVVISPEGTIKAVWDDALAPLASGGEARIRRASHVEPTADGRWQVDMRPVGGPVLPETFALRAEALAAERAWLAEHLGL